MRKTIFTVSLVVVLCSVLSVVLLAPSTETFLSKRYAVIIDAGHGAPDGGAVAGDGTTESQLNLAIAQKLYDKLTKFGVSCLMTRTGDESIYSEGTTIHAKKVSDIRNRIKLANSESDALVVSIHMNTYTSADVHGAQVFYKPKSELSKTVAEEIQNIINLKYQSDNVKSVKPIPANVYLFNHIDNDCVLIECGFLTNSDDLNKLKDEKYQNDIAQSVSEVLMYKLFGG